MAPFIAAFIYFSLILAGIAGYVMNIFAMSELTVVYQSGEATVRIVGIIIPFVGAVIGWF